MEFNIHAVQSASDEYRRTVGLIALGTVLFGSLLAANASVSLVAGALGVVALAVGMATRSELIRTESSHPTSR